MIVNIYASFLGLEFNKTSVRESVGAINEKLERLFIDKVYSDMVDEVQIDLFCLMPFMKPLKRPVYVENSKGRMPYTTETFPIHRKLFVNIVIKSFESLVAAKDSEVSEIIGREIIAYFEKVKLPMKIRKSFDKERFIDDLREFFNIPKSQFS